MHPYIEPLSPQKYQQLLLSQFKDSERQYIPIIEELEKKILDLMPGPEKHLPNLDLTQFEFIRDWLRGIKSTRDVVQILDKINLETTAKTKLLRGINKLETLKNSNIKDYIEPAKQLIWQTAGAPYVKYLTTLRQYFKYLAAIDEKQEKICWIEFTRTKSEGEYTHQMKEIPLNQLTRFLSSQVLPFNEYKYSIGDNILFLDEELSNNGRAIHWLFGPKSYIDEIKKQCHIVQKGRLESVETRILDLCKEYIKL